MISLLLAALAVAAVQATSTFQLPGGPGPAGNYRDNPVYDVGENIDIQWTSDLDYMDLYMWQDYPTPGDGTAYYKVLTSDTRSTSLIWEASFDGFSTDFPKGQDGVFYLAVYQNGTDTYDATCHYFNITQPAAATTTSAAATATTKAATASAKKDSASTTLTASTSSKPDSSSGLSSGAVAGIAVGATIGGLLFLAGVGFFVWKRLRKPKPSEQYTPRHQAPPPDYYKAELSDNHVVEMPGEVPNHQPQELYAPGGVHEAP